MWIVWLLIGAICGAVAGGVAASKGRGGFLFFVLGFLIGPFAVLGAAMMSRDGAVATRAGLDRGELRRCPHCAEPMRREAAVCPHCRNAVEPLPPLTSFFEDLGFRVAQLRGAVDDWISRGDDVAEAGGFLNSSQRALVPPGVGIVLIGFLIFIAAK